MKPPTEEVSRWLVWASVSLTVAYVAIHLGMLYDSFYLWGGLLHALIFAQ